MVDPFDRVAGKLENPGIVIPQIKRRLLDVEVVAQGIQEAGDQIATEAQKAKQEIAVGLKEAETEVKAASKEAIEKGREALDAIEKKIDESGE